MTELVRCKGVYILGYLARQILHVRSKMHVKTCRKKPYHRVYQAASRIEVLKTQANSPSIKVLTQKGTGLSKAHEKYI